MDQGEQISDFDLTILSIRNTATQGDTVNILWEVSGQDVNYLLTDVYVDNEIVYSVTESVQGREGTLSLKLPSSINPYNDHRINVKLYLNSVKLIQNSQFCKVCQNNLRFW